MKTIAPQIRLVSTASSPAFDPPAAGASQHPPNRAIDVRIEELVLHGFSRSEGRRVAASVQHELTRLVAQHGLPGFSAHAPAENLDAGAIGIAPRPESTGLRAARAIYGSLRG